MSVSFIAALQRVTPGGYSNAICNRPKRCCAASSTQIVYPLPVADRDVANLEASASTALVLNAVTLNVAPHVAAQALKQSISDFRNQRAFGVLQIVGAGVLALAASVSASVLLPLPLLFVYLGVDKFVIASRGLRVASHARARALAGEQIALKGATLIVGENGTGAGQQLSTLPRRDMRQLANRAICAAPAQSNSVNEQHSVSALVAERTVAPLLRRTAFVRALFVLATVSCSVGVLAVVWGDIASALSSAFFVLFFGIGAAWTTRSLRQGRATLQLLNEGGAAFIAAENLVVQRGDVQRAFALKPLALRSLTIKDLPQARAVVRKPV